MLNDIEIEFLGNFVSTKNANIFWLLTKKGAPSPLETNSACKLLKKIIIKNGVPSIFY